MANFKLEDNVPNVYVSKSRDFQLLCRIIDIYLNGCKNRAADIVYQLDLDNCSETLLYAIANMQGFTPSIYVPPEILRNICKVFPYCIKNKGTIKAIRAMAQAVFSSDRLIYQVNVEEGGTTSDRFTITIECDANREYVQYLQEALKYIVPAGYVIRYLVYKDIDKDVYSRFEVIQTVSRFSGIASKIMSGESALAYNTHSGVETNTYSGYFSKIGMAKIYKYDSSSAVFGDGSESGVTGAVINNEPIKVTFITTADGPLNYIGNNTEVATVQFEQNTETGEYGG